MLDFLSFHPVGSSQLWFVGKISSGTMQFFVGVRNVHTVSKIIGGTIPCKGGGMRQSNKVA